MPAIFFSADEDEGKVLVMAQVPTSVIKDKGLKANEWCQQVSTTKSCCLTKQTSLAKCLQVLHLVYYCLKTRIHNDSLLKFCTVGIRILCLRNRLKCLLNWSSVQMVKFQNGRNFVLTIIQIPDKKRLISNGVLTSFRTFPEIPD